MIAAMLPRHSPHRTMILGLLVFAAACGGPAPEAPPPRVGQTRATTPAAQRSRVLILGTSLTAGLGVAPDEAYPARIQRRLVAADLPFEIVAAGVSGETSAGALSRIDWLMEKPISVLVLETGANDGLRGQPLESLRANIVGLVARARRQQPPPQIVLVGMQTISNFGAEYRQGFAALYGEIARSEGLPLVPFLLEGVAGHRELNQADGIHPTAEGHELMAENVWRALGPILEETKTPY